MTSLQRQVLRLFFVMTLVAPGTQAQEEDKDKRRATIEYTVKLEAPKKNENACQASVAISYLQFDTRARVDATIENDACGASSGTYVVRIRVRDESGESRRMEYPETWAREDDATIETRTFYDIGQNVDLRGVSTAKLTCICTAEASQAPE